MVRREAVLEKLLNILSGFRGYRRKEYIREDDRLVREYIVGILSGAIRELEEAIANLAEYDFKAAELYDNVLRDLRTVADIGLDGPNMAMHHTSILLRYRRRISVELGR